MFEELKLNENVGAPQPDALAQIARKDDFLQQLQEFLAQHKGENWCVAAIDIEHFKLYTELYGSQQAHSLLLSLTALLNRRCPSDTVIIRIFSGGLPRQRRFCALPAG